jgi:hypothetical protein
VTLEAGSYVFTGDIRLSENATLTTNETGIYLTCAGYPTPCGAGQGPSLELSGRARVTLDSPAGGPFQKVALFLDRNGGGTITLGGKSRLTAHGAVYSRTGALRLNSSSATTIHGTLAVGTLTKSGRTRVTIDAPS